MMIEESDDGSGRNGRVRKKSAKVLEMEEFEQAEKTHHTTKKPKNSKGIASPGIPPAAAEEPEVLTPIEKSPTVKKSTKSAKAISAGLIPVESTPISSKAVPKVSVKVENVLSTSARQVLGSNDNQTLATEARTTISPVAVRALKSEPDTSKTGKGDDQKSVIKYLLSSPAAGSKPIVSSGALTKLTSQSETSEDTGIRVKKSGKRSKTPQEKSVQKPKAKKLKLENSPVIGSTDSSDPEPLATGLKMKIVSGSNPSTTILAPGHKIGGVAPTKPKKSSKKGKSGSSTDDSFSIMSPSELEVGQPKKAAPKKVSKKKEKLIQDAISAAKQMPNLAALVANPSTVAGGQVLSTQTVPQKIQKKKPKTISTGVHGGNGEEMVLKSDVPLGSDREGDDGDEEEEASLIIAETEKKKKKLGGLKKKVMKAKLKSSKDESQKKKLPKRAPTAYMLFCNTHRPTIVSDNPGIEFAGISRKLGELWSTLSSKQKLQWKRKAQRRMKKGSNLISTGKVAKDGASSGGALVMPSNLNAVKQNLFVQKIQRTEPDDTPQSPTKNFSIEPIDVSAHLKLLGESLSIIGMRLQEHKGMIAVQGSLSVLLDSLLCACGPLLCLTQQIPGMDGCSPLVHAKTLDSVAYVMPGL